MSSLDYAPIFEAILSQLPPQLQVLFSDQFFNRISVKGAAAFGFNHPLVLAILAITAIIIPAAHIAGEAETGTLELLLAYPIRRRQFILTLWLSTVTLLLLIITGAWIGAFSALAIYDYITFEIFSKMLQIGINLWLLFILIMSYALLISTFGKEGSKVGIRSAAITLIFYLLNFLSTMWESIHFIKPFNIFTYYQPQKLMFDERSFWGNAAVLLILVAVCMLAAMKQFNRRDIPG